MKTKTTNFNLRLDQDLKNRAFLVFERYGLTSSQAFKLFLTQVAETKIIPLSFNYIQDDFVPNSVTEKALLDAKNKKNFSDSYSTNEEFIKSIKELANA